jgi:hypothetical protein
MLDEDADEWDNCHMDATPCPITEPLRRAIVESGIPYLRIEQETGVQRACVSRFVAGKRTLRLDVADKLAAYFKLELRTKRNRR